jgi:hypothetical protein
MAYANPLDPTTPPDDEALSLGDDKIRQFKAAVIERLETLVTDVDADPLVLNPDTVPNTAIVDGAVDGTKIADASIVTAHLVNGAVTDSKLVTVDGAKIVDATLTGAKLQDRTVTASKIGENAVGPVELADNSVDAPNIIDGVITGGKISDDTLDTVKLTPAVRDLLSITKNISVHVVTGNHGADTQTQVASAAFAGANINDAVEIGFPDFSTETEAKLMGWKAYVDVDDHVKLVVSNESGGNKTWPTCDIKLWITKPISQW